MPDLARLQVPQLDLLIVTAGRERPAIGRNRHGIERVAVTLERADEFSILRVPQRRLAEDRRLARRGREEFSICGKGQGVHLSAQATQRANHLPHLGRKQFHLAVSRDGDELQRGREGHRLNRPARRHRGRNLRQDEFAPDRLVGFGWRKRARVDPAFEHGDFIGREFRALAGRHEFLFPIALDAGDDGFHQQAVRAFARQHRWTGLPALHQRLERFEHQLALGILCRMAIQAVLEKNRIDGGVVVRRGTARRQGRKDEHVQQPGKKQASGKGVHSVGAH